MATYPEFEGFGYSFSRAELNINNEVFTAISNVSIDQATESEAIMGTSPTPLSETEGHMDLGDGTLTFSDDRERFRFIRSLGNGFRTVKWTLSWILRNEQSGEEVQIKAYGCRVRGNPIDHAQGATALGGDIGFSFIEHEIDGLKPHG